MAATITSPFRKNNAAALVAAITEASAKYYVGIGKGDPWDGEGTSGFQAPTPSSAARDAIEAQNNLMCLKSVATDAAALMFPAFTWVSGIQYKQYDPSNDGCFYQETVTVNSNPYVYNPCYAIVGDNVYLCVRSGLSGDTTSNANSALIVPSTVQPTGTNIDTLQNADDGYIWAYLYTLDTGDSLNTTLFKRIPADPINAGNMGTVPGAIVAYRVINGGTGYTSVSDVKVVGDGTGALVNTSQVIIYDGKIVGIKRPSTAGDRGKNYTSAQVTITSTSGTGAVVIPIIAPIYGYAYNPADVLPCWFAGVQVTFDPAVDTTHLLNVNDYRQITLLKDAEATTALELSSYSDAKSIADLAVGGALRCIGTGARGIIVGIDTNASPNLVYVRQTNIGTPASAAAFEKDDVVTYTPLGDSDQFTATIDNDVTPNPSDVLSGLKYFQYAVDNTELTNAPFDGIIYQATTGAKAYVDYYDSTSFRLYYHQNNTASVNTVPFAQSGSGNPITINAASTGDTYVCTMSGEYAPRTGSVSFLENRLAISRGANQSEDIKLIVQF